jgi:hypothetical protein
MVVVVVSISQLLHKGPAEYGPTVLTQTKLTYDHHTV